MTVPTRLQIEGEISRDESRESIGNWLLVCGLVAEVLLAAFSTEKYLIEKWIGVVANALVAVGVYMEIHFGRKVSEAQKELKRRSDVEIAAANERTQLLKKQLAWREVTKEQREKFIEALRGQPGKVDFLISRDPEAEMYGQDLMQAMRAAGWDVTGGPAEWSGAVPLPGLFVSKNGGSEPITSALHAAGIEFQMGEGRPGLMLLVGSKPRPMLEQPAQ